MKSVCYGARDHQGSASLVLVAMFFVILAGGLSNPLRAEEPRWPREIQAPHARIVIYQPQIEEFRGDKLTARAAVAVTVEGKDEPVFGAVWFAATVRTDRDTRMVILEHLEVSDARFPNASWENLDKLVTILKAELSKQAQPISLDRMLTALEAARKEEAVLTSLNTAPPRIIYTQDPAVLVTIDGKPQLRPIENSMILRVANTPFVILQDPAAKKWYLRGGQDWYEAKDVQGKWKLSKKVPAAVLSLVREDAADTQPAADSPKPAKAPRIIVATEPTELIATDGKPQYKPISGTSLLYATNTDDDIFSDSKTQNLYVVLAGRWFTAKDMSGPWSFVTPDNLPADFARIPEDSPKASVLAHVPGTTAAQDAVHDTFIPQTAAIDRKNATVSVEYDGQPQFKPIEGTTMQYAVNTPNDVIQVGSQFFCCHDGVWFTASSPTGPWAVCDTVPAVIYTIPPQCPVYPVTYVEVYESTSEVVYVGYTPGYVGCYPYYGTIVYGTGWYYPGWYGPVYWPRPCTWGFNVHYNSITGAWGVRGGYSGPNGWVAFGYRDGIFYHGAWIAGGWWGHGGFHDFNFRPNVVYSNRVTVGNVRTADRNNIYNRQTNVDRLRDRPEAARPVAQPLPADRTAARDRPADAPGVGDKAPVWKARNDVYADRNGNIYRRTDQGTWEQRVGDSWAKPDFDAIDHRPSQIPDIKRPASPLQADSRAKPPARPMALDVQLPRASDRQGPVARPAVQPSTPQNLNLDCQARSRGDARTSNFSSYGSGGGYNFHGGGGGFHGGRR